MRKWLPLALFFLFTYDVAVDSFGGECKTPAAEACHACLCGTHAAAPAVGDTVSVVAVTARVVASPHFVPPQSLFDESVFHPPQPAA